MDLQRFNHPLTFAIAITFVVTGMQALLRWLFTKLGWSGPAALFGAK